MKIWERTPVRRLGEHIKISPQQFGFATAKSTTDAIFIARQLHKYLQNEKELYHIFVDLEKAFDKVPRPAISWALRRQMLPEYQVKAVMGLYTNSSSRVRFAGGVWEISKQCRCPSRLSLKSSAVQDCDGRSHQRGTDRWPLGAVICWWPGIVSGL